MAAQRDPKKRLIEAALALARERPWRDVSLSDIAEKAGIELPDLALIFNSKADLLAAFISDTDIKVLERLASDEDGEGSARDRLFDAVMIRFEILEAHKGALKGIAADAGRDPGQLAVLIKPFVDAQRWMLVGAGIDVENRMAPLKISGLGLVYANVFRTWLGDDDPGLAKTMATLDRALRRGETWLNRANLPLSAGAALVEFARGWRRARSSRNEGRARDETTAADR